MASTNQRKDFSLLSDKKKIYIYIFDLETVEIHSVSRCGCNMASGLWCFHLSRAKDGKRCHLLPPAATTVATAIDGIETIKTKFQTCHYAVIFFKRI